MLILYMPFSFGPNMGLIPYAKPKPSLFLKKIWDQRKWIWSRKKNFPVFKKSKYLKIDKNKPKLHDDS